jgi:hypothetical protein
MNAQQSGMSVWVETEVTITHSKPELGFAFGKAMIDGEISSIYVSSRCHSIYDADGYWEISGEIVTPERGDEIFAKVNTKVSNGKKPYAAFWQFASQPTEPEELDDYTDLDSEYRCLYCGRGSISCSCW